MNEFDEWLDGVRRWFYGGEPGLDDLPLDEYSAADQLPERPQSVRGGIVIQHERADTLRGR